MSNCIVLDPFGGSGSTLIACEQTNRICHTIELDEKFCDVIVKRYIEPVSYTHLDVYKRQKSTFWNAIARVLGSYSGTISADALTVGGKRNVKPEMAELKGKRLVIAAELEEGVRLNTSIVKQLCSTDEDVYKRQVWVGRIFWRKKS